MSAILWALLTVITTTGFLLVLQKAMSIWPVGLGGCLSRIVTVGVLVAWVGMRGRGFSRLACRPVWRWVLVMGLVSTLINILWFSAFKWTTATNVALIFRMDLLFVVLIGGLGGFERLNRVGLWVLPVMILGFLLLTEVQKMDFTGHLTGDFMIVGAALGFAVNAFVIRHILKEVDEIAVAAYNHLMSGLGFVVLAWMMPAWRQLPRLLSDGHALLWLVLMGLMAAISLPIYYAALHRMEVWKLRVMLLLCPMLVALYEWMFEIRRMSALQWLGGGILLGGALVLILSEARFSKRSTSPEVPGEVMISEEACAQQLEA